jgi:hypothetical protein
MGLTRFGGLVIGESTAVLYSDTERMSEIKDREMERKGEKQIKN